MISARLDHAPFLGNVRAAVVDELHSFAGDDRGWHLLFLLARLERLSGRRIQRIGLTATVGNPAELLGWFSAGRELATVNRMTKVASLALGAAAAPGAAGTDAGAVAA